MASYCRDQEPDGNAIEVLIGRLRHKLGSNLIGEQSAALDTLLREHKFDVISQLDFCVRDAVGGHRLLATLWSSISAA
jgi:hypothetical protein